MYNPHKRGLATLKASCGKFHKIPEEKPYGSLDEMLRVELGVASAEEARTTKQRPQQAAEKTTGEVLPPSQNGTRRRFPLFAGTAKTKTENAAPVG